MNVKITSPFFISRLLTGEHVGAEGNMFTLMVQADTLHSLYLSCLIGIHWSVVYINIKEKTWHDGMSICYMLKICLI
jgi:hypothetical protein